MLTLKESTEVCSLLADSSRQRLLLLLRAHALSAAELTEVTGLAQSRVSTHLAKLKKAGLVQTEKNENAALYAASDPTGTAAELWKQLSGLLNDAQVSADLERAVEVIRARSAAQTWAESVAGRMERHYSPGRTWEATAHALIGLLRLGEVLDLASGDGVFAELIAPRCQSITCLDVSETVLAAARRRLAGLPNVTLQQGDMHALPFKNARFDCVFALHALACSAEPSRTIAEAARVLRPGGQLVIAALKSHPHNETMRIYDHRNLGFETADLEQLIAAEGLKVLDCAVTSQETRPPYFEVITALARK